MTEHQGWPPAAGPAPYHPAPAPAASRSAPAAALGNLTGLGLGYAYLGRWWRMALHLAITAALVVIAFVTGAAALPWLWVVVALAWLGWMAVDAWRIAGAHHPAPRGAAAQALPVAAAVVLVAVVVGGYVLYGAGARASYAEATAARDRGDCATALPQYERVTGIYRLAPAGDVAAADADGAECAAFVAATDARDRGEFAESVRLHQEFRRAHPNTVLTPFVGQSLRDTYTAWATMLRSSADFAGAVRVYRDLLVEVGTGPAAAQVRAELAATYVDEANARRAQLAGTDDPLRLDAARVAMGNLLLVQRELADTPSAAIAQQGIQDTYAAAVTQGTTGRWCESTPLMDYFVGLPDAETAGLVGRANADRATTLYQCGSVRYGAGDFPGAAMALDQLVGQYPNDPQVAQARSLSIAAKVADATGTAPAVPAPYAGDSPGPIALTIYNDNPDELRIFVVGATAHEVVVPGCGDCPASYPAGADACPSVSGKPSVTLRLRAGDYTVVGLYPDSTTSVSQTTLEGGFTYTNCQYRQDR